MRVGGDWIENVHVQDVLAMLSEGGHQALLVGGCIRNALLGYPVADIDIATDAVPERVMELARNAGLKPVPTGIDHGTITVVANGEPHEVTTFRRDVETFGRRAVVAYSTKVEDDAARRDFTMNALYAEADGRVIDPLGGLPDLKARRVRFVGDAGQRIREDYLRILRFFRFHAWYGDETEGLDAEGLAACAANSAGIETLSKERLGHEMRRLLAAPDPAPSVAAMQATGVLARVLPRADARALAPLVHVEGSYAPAFLRRLAVLGGENPEEALRLSRKESRYLTALREGVAGPAGAAELAYRLGAEAAHDIVLLRAALSESPLPDGWESEVARGAAAEFPLRAGDLTPGLEGAALGARLKKLEARWIASGFTMSRDQLLS